VEECLPQHSKVKGFDSDHHYSWHWERENSTKVRVSFQKDSSVATDTDMATHLVVIGHELKL
jgi:hypothetical protein